MRTKLLIIATAGFLFAAPAIAFQNPAPPDATQPASTRRARPNRQAPAPPLSGPKVEATDAPGAAMSFGSEAGQAARAYKSNLRQYAAILKAMDLSEAQRREAEAIIREYGEVVRAYQQEHAAELQQLREKMIRANGPGDPRAAGAPRTDQAPQRRPGATDARPSRPTDRATDQPSDRPTEPRRVRPTDRATDQPTDRPIDPRRVRPTDRVTDRPANRATDRRPDAPTDRPATRPAPPTDARPDAPADAPRRPLAGQRPGAGQTDWPVQSKEAREVLERVMEIRRGAPPQEPFMKRLYELLADEQKVEFDRQLEEIRQAQMEQQMRRRLAAAGVSPEAMQQMDGMQRDDSGRPIIDESQFTPQMRERLRRMRQQRRQMLENREQQNPTPPSPDDIEFEKPKR